MADGIEVVFVPVAALRALFAVYDTWWNKVGTFDPGDELVSDGVKLSGIGALLDSEDCLAMDTVGETAEPFEPTIRLLLGEVPNVQVYGGNDGGEA